MNKTIEETHKTLFIKEKNTSTLWTILSCPSMEVVVNCCGQGQDQQQQQNKTTTTAAATTNKQTNKQTNKRWLAMFLPVSVSVLWLSPSLGVPAGDTAQALVFLLVSVCCDTAEALMFLLVSVCCDTAQVLVLLLVSACCDTAHVLVFLLVSACCDTAQVLMFLLVSHPCVVKQSKPWCSCWCQCLVTQPKPWCSCWRQRVVTQPKQLETDYLTEWMNWKIMKTMCASKHAVVRGYVLEQAHDISIYTLINVDTAVENGPE